MTDMQSAVKPVNAQQQQQQPMYHINALAYDNAAFARQQSIGSAREMQLGQLRRGFSFGITQFDEGSGSMADNAGLEVLVTPNFSSQELNMLLDVSWQTISNKQCSCICKAAKEARDMHCMEACSGVLQTAAMPLVSCVLF